jgi:hypothetical protein
MATVTLTSKGQLTIPQWPFGAGAIQVRAGGAVPGPPQAASGDAHRRHRPGHRQRRRAEQSIEALHLRGAQLIEEINPDRGVNNDHSCCSASSASSSRRWASRSPCAVPTPRLPACCGVWAVSSRRPGAEKPRCGASPSDRWPDHRRPARSPFPADQTQRPSPPDRWPGH